MHYGTYFADSNYLLAVVDEKNILRMPEQHRLIASRMVYGYPHEIDGVDLAKVFNEWKEKVVRFQDVERYASNFAKFLGSQEHENNLTKKLVDFIYSNSVDDYIPIDLGNESDGITSITACDTNRLEQKIEEGLKIFENRGELFRTTIRHSIADLDVEETLGHHQFGYQKLPLELIDYLQENLHAFAAYCVTNYEVRETITFMGFGTNSEESQIQRIEFGGWFGKFILLKSKDLVRENFIAEPEIHECPQVAEFIESASRTPLFVGEQVVRLALNLTIVRNLATNWLEELDLASTKVITVTKEEIRIEEIPIQK